MYVRRTTLCKLFLKAFVHYIFAAFTSHPISPNYFFFFLFQADAINAGIGGKKVVFLGSLQKVVADSYSAHSSREIQISNFFLILVYGLLPSISIDFYTPLKNCNSVIVFFLSQMSD